MWLHVLKIDLHRFPIMWLLERPRLQDAPRVTWQPCGPMEDWLIARDWQEMHPFTTHFCTKQNSFAWKSGEDFFCLVAVIDAPSKHLVWLVVDIPGTDCGCEAWSDLPEQRQNQRLWVSHFVRMASLAALDWLETTKLLSWGRTAKQSLEVRKLIGDSWWAWAGRSHFTFFTMFHPHLLSNAGDHSLWSLPWVFPRDFSSAAPQAAATSSPEGLVRLTIFGRWDTETMLTWYWF